jgi:hypothetical protein
MLEPSVGLTPETTTWNGTMRVTPEVLLALPVIELVVEPVVDPLATTSVPSFVNSNGRYYRPFGMQDNHATTLFYESEDNFRRVFDTYDSPCIKDVEWDVIPMVVKRFTIEKKVINSFTKPSLWSRIIAWFLKFYKL